MSKNRNNNNGTGSEDACHMIVLDQIQKSKLISRTVPRLKAFGLLFTSHDFRLKDLWYDLQQILYCLLGRLCKHCYTGYIPKGEMACHVCDANALCQNCGAEIQDDGPGYPADVFCESCVEREGLGTLCTVYGFKEEVNNL